MLQLLVIASYKYDALVPHDAAQANTCPSAISGQCRQTRVNMETAPDYNQDYSDYSDYNQYNDSNCSPPPDEFFHLYDQLALYIGDYLKPGPLNGTSSALDCLT